MSETHPAPTLTYQQAVEHLTTWCQEHQSVLVSILSCVQANYAADPFYAVRARLLWRGPKGLTGRYAFHVHRDGSVDLVARETRG